MLPTSFYEYLIPTTPIAKFIVEILQFLFLLWFIGLLIYVILLLSRYIQIRKNQNVQMLVDALKERDIERENEHQPPEKVFNDFCKKDEADDGYPVIKQIKSIFLKGSLGKRSPIAKHLQAIFLAGWNESRLEVGELNNHTTTHLFRWNSLFRSVLAVFIVIGLLGTLFGLAGSLTDLSPPLKEISSNEVATENSEKMSQALGNLLDDIKGALAPSIWGIIFTVGGVLIYGIYLQYPCHPLKSILERSTLTFWAPQLYPTTSQKMIETLQKSEEQMRSGYKTASQIGELVENVQGNISEFNGNLRKANAITKPLSDSALQINEAASHINSATDVLSKGFTESLSQFSQEFAENVTHLTGFQDEIRSLHQDFQKDAKQSLNEQTQNLEKVLDTLKIYEATYIKSREQIDETLQNFINAATEVNTSVHEQNREWFEQINTNNREQFLEIQGELRTDLTNLQQTLEDELKNLSGVLENNLKSVQVSLDERLETLTVRLENFDTPLKEVVEESRENFDRQLETLNKKLSDFDEPFRKSVDQIRETFDTKLETLNERLENFDTPLKEAAEGMKGTFANLVTYMRTIVGDLQGEIEKQNKNYAQQLTEAKNLSASVKSLLEQLGESSSNQKSAVDELSANVENLDKTIKAFTSDSEVLSQSVNTIKGDIEKLGNASEQFVKKVENADVTPLTAGIDELNTSIKEISQHSHTLANAVNTLEKQERPSKAEQNPKDSQEISAEPEPKPKPSIFGRIRNRMFRRKTDG